MCLVGTKGRGTIFTTSLPTRSAGTTDTHFWHDINEQHWYTDESFEALEVAKG